MGMIKIMALLLISNGLGKQLPNDNPPRHLSAVVGRRLVDEVAEVNLSPANKDEAIEAYVQATFN